MKLDEVPSGSVYVDTNILYMYLRADPAHVSKIGTFLRRVVRGEISAHVGIIVLDELFYRLLLAHVKEGTDRNPLDALRENQAWLISTHARVIETNLRKFVGLPHLHLVGVDTSDFDRMLNNIAMFSLLPRDALNVAIIQRLGLTAVASDDTDFDRVAGLERHWVINPPQQANN